MNSDTVTTNLTQSLPFSGPLEWNPQAREIIRSVNRSSMLVAATGTGKTVMMAGIAGHWPVGRVMMISHRFELNQQAIRTFERICGVEVDLEQAEYRADRRWDLCPIVVASVQTLCSKSRGMARMEKFDPREFGLLMIDECHHAIAPQYRKVIDYFKRNPDLRILGVTATPDRLDGVGLGRIFDNVCCDLNILWGIENGWLVPVRQAYVQIEGLDLRKVHTRGGDLHPDELARVLEVEETLHEMAKPIADACKDRQGIVFTVSVEQAHQLAEVIERYSGKQCAAIDGETPSHQRAEVLDGYRDGSIQVLVNCSVFTEGFDAPNTKVIAVARPTKSRALYTQCVGRGTRPLPGVVDSCDGLDSRLAAIAASEKPDCLVLDFIGQSGRHKLIATGDILAGPNDPPEIVERAKAIIRKGFDGTTTAALAAAREEARRREEAKRNKVTVDVRYKLREAEHGYNSVPEVFCPGYLKHRPATDKQKAIMRKLGYTEEQIARMNPRSASSAIDYAVKNPRTSFGRWLHNKKIEEGTL